MAEKRIIEWQECLDCGFRGSSAKARRHAEERGCRDFRIYTRVLCPTGRILDERIEVYQRSPEALRGPTARAA